MLPSSQFVEIWKQSFDALSTLQLNGADICAMRVFAVILFYGLIRGVAPHLESPIPARE
jgi:hypothetical protein